MSHPSDKEKKKDQPEEDDDKQHPKPGATLSTQHDDDEKYRASEDPSSHLVELDQPVTRGFDALGPTLGATLVDHRPLPNNSEVRPDQRQLGSRLMDKGALAALQSAAAAAATPPAPAGDYIEPHYSVKALPECKAPKIFEELGNVLSNLQVDFFPELADFRIRCFHYVAAQEIPFVISLFTVDDSIVIEFQRRFGDVMAFCDLYKLSLFQLAQRKIIADSSVPQTKRSFRPPELKKPPQPTDQDIQITREAIRGVVSMVKSDYIDVKIEGIYALAQLTKEQDKASIIVEESKADLLACLEHPNPHIHRAALTILANLAEKIDDFAATVPRDRIYSLTHHKDSSPQIIREAARFLQAYAFKMKAAAASDESLRVTLKRLALHNKDPRTGEFARTALQFIGQASQ